MAETARPGVLKRRLNAIIIVEPLASDASALAMSFLVAAAGCDAVSPLLAHRVVSRATIGRFQGRVQLIAATHSANFSAGV
jgi:hypothetical protein